MTVGVRCQVTKRCTREKSKRNLYLNITKLRQLSNKEASSYSVINTLKLGLVFEDEYSICYL